MVPNQHVSPQHVYTLSSVVITILFLGAMVNWTYGTHKNLYISLFSLTIFVPINFDPP